MNIKITHISAATVLLEIGSIRLLTDPVFDPAGGSYYFGWGTGSRKLTSPSIPLESLGQVDAVLLSHDQHEDNLDKAGRAYLPNAKRILTTPIGEKRLKGNAEGLAAWQSTTLESGETKIKITATPAQHGPALVHLLSGAATGFMLEWDGQKNGAFYITGDTIYFHGIDEIAERFKVDTALFHLGKASFPITGPIRFTMNAKDGVKAARKLKPRSIIPTHYEGWKHFREGKSVIESEFEQAGLSDKLRWLPIGEPVELDI